MKLAERMTPQGLMVGLLPPEPKEAKKAEKPLEQRTLKELREQASKLGIEWADEDLKADLAAKIAAKLGEGGGNDAGE